MKYELIKTEKYLLVVSHDKNEEGNFIYETNIGEVSRVDREYYELLKTGVKVEPFVKVLAYLPLNGAEYLEGVDVLPEIEDEVDKEAKEFANESASCDYEEGINVGKYQGFVKAKEKYKYTLSDMKRAFNCGRDSESIDRFEDWRTFVRFIDSLEPKLPIAFECEMKEYGQYDCGVFMKDDEEQIKITNSEGRTEWVGKYIFNN